MQCSVWVERWSEKIVICISEQVWCSDVALVTVAMSRLPQLSGPEDQLPEEACTCASVQTTPAPANQTP